jgi:Zn-dependent protease
MELLQKFLYYLNLNFGISNLLYSLPGIILAFTVHEFSHGFAAYMMGDNTAKSYGRLTLNPIAHIDPIGFLCLILTQRFGWAKPVPVNDMNFRNRRLGMLLVSLAGPVSNFITAFVLALLYALLYDKMSNAVISMFGIAYIINLSIGVFNLIPIPPLDGSNILDAFLTDRQRFIMRRYALYSNIIMLFLIFSGFIGTILNPFIEGLNTFINFAVRLII